MYLITGGAGFIGSNLAETLVNSGHEVIVADNLSTGTALNLPKSVKCWSSIQSLLNYLDNDDDIEGIFHLGAPSNSLIYRLDRSLVGTSIKDFAAILDYCRSHKTRLVYVSSSSVYNGNPTPWVENMPIVPKDFYAETRYFWERLAKIYYDFYGVNSIGLRLFSVYGVKERHKGIYANLLSQLYWAKEKDEIFPIYGNGEQERDTVYVSDVVKAFWLSMISNIECDVFNVGTGKNYTLNQMAEIVDAKIKYIPTPLVNYVEKTLADTSKAKNLLGFEAEISIEQGLELISKERVNELCD
jgi:UDP-glucose 4-epimerase